MNRKLLIAVGFFVLGLTLTAYQTISTIAYLDANMVEFGVRGKVLGANTFSDSFTFANSTPLASYNSNWITPDPGYTVSKLEIYNNQARVTSSWSNGGAMYNASVSDTSKIVVKAAALNSKFVCVRMGIGSGIKTGYCAVLSVASGGNWTNVNIEKNKIWKKTIAVNASQDVDHTLKIIANGTASVTVDVYLDGIKIDSFSDSSSPLGALGHPGFLIIRGGNLADAYIDDWADGDISSSPPPASDLIPPVISSVIASNITASGADISWSTDENSDTQVEYGLTTSYGTQSVLNPSLSTGHNVSVTSLTNNTNYHYRVKSKDSAGNLAASSDMIFSTLTAPVIVSDTSSPSVPANLIANAVGASAIKLSWAASTDNIGVAGYKIYRNGLQAAIITSGLSYSDTGLFQDTIYSYTVSAYDAAGNNSAQSAAVSARTQKDSIVITPPGQGSISMTGADGILRSYALRDHPRVWLDGSNGPLTLALKDPDGNGPLVSPRASSVPGAATYKEARDYRKTWNGDMSGSVPMATALGWFMNNNAAFSDGTKYKDDFIDSITNRVVNAYTFGGCDLGAVGCGNINVDYAGEWMTAWAIAFTTIRSELTLAQRSHVAALMLNGITDPGACETRLKRRAGTVSKVGSMLTLSGGVWDSTIVPGAMIYTKSVDTHGNSGSWQLVISVQSPTQITTDTEYGNSTGYWYFTMDPWDDSKSCGLGNMASQHANTPNYIAKSSTAKTTASISAILEPLPLEGVTQTITVDTANWSPQNLPFSIRVGGSYLNTAEQMKVIAVNGNTLTVVRGLYDKTLSFGSGVPVIYYSHSNFADEPGASFGLNNRNLTRSSGYIALALALADDDPRARQLLDLATPYWYAKTYLPAKEYFTIHNVSAIDYGLGRITSHFSSIVLAFKNSFTQSAGFENGEYIKNYIGLLPIYWTVPWNDAMFSDWGIIANLGGCSTNYRGNPACQTGLFTMPLLYPDSIESKWAWFHHRTLMGSYMDSTAFNSKLSTGSGWGQGFVTARWLIGGDQSGVDYRGTLPTSKVWATGDLGGTKGLGSFVSRTDWTPNTTVLYGLFFDQFSDKLVSDNASTYSIGKNGWLIDNSSASNSSGQKAIVSSEQQGIDFGPAYKGGYSTTIGDSNQNILANKTSSDFLYTKIDATGLHIGNNNYHQVSGQFRYFVHLKTDKEYIIAFDNVSKGNAERVRDFIHYPNNGESGEGMSSLDATADSFSSSNGSAKIITQWLTPVSGADSKVYDIGVSISGSVVTVGKDCSTSSPCRVKVGGTVHTITTPGTFTLSGTPAGTSAAFIYLDPGDGKLKAGWQSGMSGQVCGGSLQCMGIMSDFPAGAVRLGRPTYKSNLPEVSQCPGALAVNSYTPAKEWDNCVGSSDRVLFIDAGTTANAEFLIVHRPTANLNETKDDISSPTSLSSNFSGVQIKGASPAIVIFPKNGQSYSALTFTSEQIGSTRIFISGLNSGNYTVKLNGVFLMNMPVAADGTIFFRGQAGDYSIFSDGLPADTTPPTIPTNLTATGISSSAINLSWSASSDNIGVVGYKIYRGGVQVGTTITNNYNDNSLTVGTSYNYTVSAYDSAGNNSSQSNSASGSTLSNPDTTAPTVSLTAPASGTVSGNITFSAVASDPNKAGQTTSGLKLVTLYIDGTVYATSSSGSISKSLITTTLTNASHTLTAQAIDNAGNNSTIATVTITVNNAPAVKYPRIINLSNLEGVTVIPSNQSLTATILSGSIILRTQTLAPNASKQYTVTFLSSDPQLVNIRVKVNGYLSKLLSNIDTTINTATVSSIPQLLTGDINNDNVINSLDYSSLNTNWLKITITADMNQDGVVNSFDFAILKNNWGRVGE